MESFFLSQGCLIPPAHSGYWIGLNTDDEPKNANSWTWIDRTPAPTPSNYVKWGTRKPQNIPEPANLMGAETCGSANVSEAFAGTWGWASQQCKQELVYMCEQNREWHAQPAACGGLPAWRTAVLIVRRAAPVLVLVLVLCFAQPKCYSVGTATMGQHWVQHHCLVSKSSALTMLPHWPAAPGLFYYTSNATNNSYILSTYENHTWAQAQQFCNDRCGNLVSYSNVEEQVEVEKYYTDMVGCCCCLWCL